MFKNYLQKTKTYSTGRFIIELTFVSIIGKILVGMAGMSIASIISDFNVNELPTRGIKDSTNFATAIILYSIIVPIFETMIFQWLPVKLLQKVISNVILIIFIDAILFALAHWSFGFVYVMAMLPGGIVLAWSFISKANDSTFKALWITSSIHGLGNLSALLSIFFL